MRIASGVVLIVAALFNLIAAFGYLAGGAASQGMSSAVDSAYVQEQMGGSQLTDEQQAQVDRIKADAGATGVGLLAFGVFLLISVGVLIAGAVFLFTGKKATFILAAGGIAILAEVIGVLITGFGVTNLVGLAGGAMAIFAARSMGAVPTLAPASAD